MRKISLPPIPPRSQKLIAIFLVIITVILSYDLILSPHRCYLKASEKKSRIAGMHEKKLDETETKSRLYEQKVFELKTFRQEAGKRLFGPSEADAYFSQLTPMAVESGCQVGSISFHTLANPPERLDLEDQNASTLQFRGTTLNLVGPYDGWIRFLGTLESSGRIVLLSRFTLRSGEGAGPLLEGDLELAVPILLDIPETLLIPPAEAEDEEDMESDEDDEEENADE